MEDYAQLGQRHDLPIPDQEGVPLPRDSMYYPNSPDPGQVAVPLSIPDQEGVPLPIPDQEGVPLPIPDQEGVPLPRDSMYYPNSPTVQGVAQIKQAVAAGYSYQDVVDHHDAQGVPAPVRPALSDIYAGIPVTSRASAEGDVGVATEGDIRMTRYPTMEELSQPGRDKINEGAGPIGEVVLAGAAGGVAGAVRGAISTGVLGDISGAVESRIAGMGVTTSTKEAAGAGAKSLATQDTDSAVIKTGLKYGVAGEAAREVMFEGLPGEGAAKNRSGIIPEFFSSKKKKGE